jgi:hypothetical protein
MPLALWVEMKNNSKRTNKETIFQHNPCVK